MPESVIESVWAAMKRRVELEQPQCRYELEHVVRSVWDKMSPEFINAIVEGMPSHLIQAIANDGGTVQDPLPIGIHCSSINDFFPEFLVSFDVRGRGRSRSKASKVEILRRIGSEIHDFAIITFPW
jgi:hypothetical protein